MEEDEEFDSSAAGLILDNQIASFIILYVLTNPHTRVYHGNKKLTLK